MNIHDVNKGVHQNRKRKRVGRGTGSGRGKTSGRGHKGQGSLRGWSQSRGFEGGQFPLFRRVPKRGFHNKFARDIAIVNLVDLDRWFKAGEEVTPAALEDRSVIQVRYELIKVLAKGKLTKKLLVSAHLFSEAARAAIEQAGGTVTVLPGPQPVARPEKPAKSKSKS
jgi:large subunit ribosomal protein L15